jgi:hypothetical protein
MTMDNLLDRLVKDLSPVPPHYVVRRLLAGAGGGAAVSLLLVAILMGYRPDMAAAALTPMFWWKLIYVLALAVVAVWSADRFARPGGAEGWKRGRWAIVPLAWALGLAAWQLLSAPAADRPGMIMGGSALGCPWYIVAYAAPPMMGLIWAVRGLAPTRLGQAGVMIGLAGGGLGAAAYALHCTESTAPFLAIWYTLGIAGAAAIGGILGPFILQWPVTRLHRR